MCVQGPHSVGLMWWMLAREVLRMRGTISREHPWEVMPDLYFYRDPEEVRLFYTKFVAFQKFRIFFFVRRLIPSVLVLSVCFFCAD